MRFENPLAVIYIFWSIPLITLFWFFVIRMRRRDSERFIDKNLWPEVLASLDIHRLYIKAVLISLAIILLLVTLTQPQSGFRWQELRKKGLDIIFCVDTSKSMLADDIKPSRLERAKLAIRDMMALIKGDRVGLVAFAGMAFVQSPLTTDYDGFLLALDDLDITIIPRGGTSISNAIKEAIGAYDKVETRSKVLILITDGEEHEGDALKAAGEAKKEKVKIFCVGVGTPAGTFLPPAPGEVKKDFLKDKYGNRIKSQLNEELLKKIAFIADGAYIRSSTTDFGLALLYREKISLLEKKEIKSDKRKIYYERFQIPLALVILLLCAELIINERRNIR